MSIENSKSATPNSYQNPSDFISLHFRVRIVFARLMGDLNFAFVGALVFISLQCVFIFKYSASSIIRAQQHRCSPSPRRPLSRLPPLQSECNSLICKGNAFQCFSRHAVAIITHNIIYRIYEILLKCKLKYKIN